MDAQAKNLEKALSKLMEVDQVRDEWDEGLAEGLATTAEDLVSAGVMNHPVGAGVACMCVCVFFRLFVFCKRVYTLL